MFYEVTWCNETTGRRMPQPWWIQEYFRKWINAFDDDLFDFKQGAFSSNAPYRCRNMVGVKDARQEILVGQAGEIELLDDKHPFSSCLFDPATHLLHMSHFPGVAANLTATLALCKLLWVLGRKCTVKKA